MTYPVKEVSMQSSPVSHDIDSVRYFKHRTAFDWSSHSGEIPLWALCVLSLAICLAPSAIAADSTVTAHRNVDNTYPTSLAINAGGYPVVAYWTNTAPDGTLWLLVCQGQTNCHGTKSIENPAAGRSPSLQLDASGNPVIAFVIPEVDPTPDRIVLLHCDNATCSGDQSGNIVDVGETSVGRPSLALDINEFPVITYINSSHEIEVVHCNDVDCAGNDESVSTVTSATDNSNYLSMALDSNGYPVVAHLRTAPLASRGLYILHCNDANCSGNDESLVLQSVGFTSIASTRVTSLKLDSNGYPVVAYYEGANIHALRILHCNDANCTGDDESVTSPDNTAFSKGDFPSLVLDSNDYPVVSFQGTEGEMAVMHCNDVNCAGGDESIVAPKISKRGSSGTCPSIVLVNSNPVVSDCSRKGGVNSLRITTCDDPDCAK
jgi:hypothetical protein